MWIGVKFTCPWLLVDRKFIITIMYFAIQTIDLALALSEIVQGLQKLVRSERKCLISLGGIKRGTFLFLRPKHRTTFQSKILHCCINGGSGGLKSLNFKRDVSSISRFLRRLQGRWSGPNQIYELHIILTYKYHHQM